MQAKEVGWEDWEVWVWEETDDRDLPGPAGSQQQCGDIP